MLEWHTITSILVFLSFLYAISIVVFLLLQNRSPQSTIAWMFALLLFPFIGVGCYLMFGRSRKAFSRERKLVRQELGQGLTKVLMPLATQQEELIARMKAEEETPYHKLLELVRQNSNSMLTAYNTVDILQDAAEKYPRLLADMKQASQFIHLEYYIWDSDEFTEQVKEILINKVNEGVEVRLLYDAVGSQSLSNRYLRELREGGIEVYPGNKYLELLKFHTLGYRNHRKIVVIDGQIGYLGGLNMSQEHLDGGKHFSSWRDTHLRMTGQVVSVLQAIFVTSWYNLTYQTLSDERYFPPQPDSIGYLPIQITTSGPDSQWAAIRQLYFLMILAAKKHVYIQSPFFIPNDSISEALKAAALSGVEIKIMCTPRGSLYSLPYWAANTYFADMVRAGIRIFLYQKGYFHPKTISIDSEVCSVGTANMDIRSFSINYEANAIIYESRIAKELEEDFLHDLEDCTEFTLEEYKKRHILLRFRDSVARLFSPLM
jgi:cardiolipin synthase